MRYLVLAVLVGLLAPALFAEDGPETTLNDSGLTFRTDGFRVNIHTAVQFRLTYHDTRGEGSNGDNGRDFVNFGFPGVRTFIHGHVFDPQFQYRIWLVFSWPGTIRIEDAFFRWTPHSLINVTVGQDRVPASWEYLVDHERTGFTQRAIADEVFSQGWGKGVSVSGSAALYETGNFEEGTLWWKLGVYNGVLASPDGAQGRGEIGANGVNVTDAGKTEHFKGGFRNDDWRITPETFGQLVDTEMMVAARVEFHPMGAILRHMRGLGESYEFADWKMMVGVAVNWMSARTDGIGTFLGNIYHNTDSASALPPTASGRPRVRASTFHGTVDGHFRWIGLSVNWALHYRRTNFAPTGSLRDFDVDDAPSLPTGVEDFGATVDVGYFILNDELSIQSRFSWVDFDEFVSRQLTTGDRVKGDSFGADSWEYGGGVTWYLHGDNLKLSADYRYVVQQLPHGNGPLSGGARTSDYRVFQEIRVQLQWIF